MGDHQQTGKPLDNQQVNQPGQLSLAIPPSVNKYADFDRLPRYG